ncbi:MAG: hypothetical protein LIR50_15010 [Bacillota bacterium]|nr:hypothetical protein [Bacillota bacterium]
MLFWRSKINNKLYKIFANCGIYNKEFYTFKIKDIEEKEFGYSLKLYNVPGLSYDLIEDNLQSIQDSFPCLLEYSRNHLKGYCSLNIITKDFNKKPFDIVKIKNPFEVFAGYGVNGMPIIINLDKFPHILIAGITGSGKSRLLLSMVLNILLNNNNAKLYLTQIGKFDFECVRYANNVVDYATTLEDANTMFNDLYLEAERREELFRKNKVINIAEYNKKFKDKQLSRIYNVCEEFSLYMPSDDDSDEERQLKQTCYAKLLKLGKLGRSAGINLIGCLQRTTADNLNPTLKQLLVNKIVLNQGASKISSRNVLENDLAVGLPTGEAIYFNGNEYKRIIAPFIGDQEIWDLGKRCGYKKKTYKSRMNKEKSNPLKSNNKIKHKDVIFDNPFAKVDPNMVFIDKTFLPPIGQMEKAHITPKKRKGRLD